MILEGKIRTFIDKRKPFTVFDLSGNDATTFEVLKTQINYNLEPVYNKASVAFEGLDFDLYYPSEFIPANYTFPKFAKKLLKQSIVEEPVKIEVVVAEAPVQEKEKPVEIEVITKPVKEKPKKKRKEKFENPFFEFNNKAQVQGKIYSYQPVIQGRGLIEIRPKHLVKKHLENAQFNIVLMRDTIILKKADLGIRGMATRGQFIIKRSELDACDLMDKQLWCHIYKTKIVMNIMHPVFMYWQELYLDSFIAFHYQTETERKTILLKVAGFEEQNNEYFVVGYPLAGYALEDDLKLDHAKERYDLKKIYKKSVMCL